MRALCGAIITAGALIGLGLTALAYGLRFQGLGPEAVHGEHNEMYGIPSMTMVLVVLMLATLIGLAISFLGLAFHHERRHREQLHEMGAHSHATLP